MRADLLEDFYYIGLFDLETLDDRYLITYIYHPFYSLFLSLLNCYIVIGCLKAVYFQQFQLLNRLIQYGTIHGVTKYRIFMTVKGLEESLNSGLRSG